MVNKGCAVWQRAHWHDQGEKEYLVPFASAYIKKDFAGAEGTGDEAAGTHARSESAMNQRGRAAAAREVLIGSVE